MTSNDTQESDVYHYAACWDCKLWKYTDTREEAHEAAEAHEEETEHNAYAETLEGTNVR